MGYDTLPFHERCVQAIAKYYIDQNKDDGAGVCSVHGRHEKYMRSSRGRSRRKKLLLRQNGLNLGPNCDF